MIARQQVLINQGCNDCVLQIMCSHGKLLYKTLKQDWSAPLDWLEGHLCLKGAPDNLYEDSSSFYPHNIPVSSSDAVPALFPKMCLRSGFLINVFHHEDGCRDSRIILSRKENDNFVTCYRRSSNDSKPSNEWAQETALQDIHQWKWPRLQSNS